MRAGIATGVAGEPAPTIRAGWDLGPGVERLVSYIVPAYNAEGWIGDLLASASEQAYRPIEVIVVDDGSTDGTAGVVERFARTHGGGGFDIVLVRQPNGGCFRARNAGARRARGEFLGHLDSDDLLPAHRTSDLVDALDKTQADAAWGGISTCFSEEEARLAASARNGGPAGLVPDPGEWRHEPQHPCLLLRRGFAARLGPYYEGLANGADYEFVVRMRLLEPRIARVDSTVYVYRIREGSLFGGARRNAGHARNRMECVRLIARNLAELGRLEDPRNGWLAKDAREAAVQCCRFGLRREARAGFRIAAMMDGGGRRRRMLGAAASAVAAPGVGRLLAALESPPVPRGWSPGSVFARVAWRARRALDPVYP